MSRRLRCGMSMAMTAAACLLMPALIAAPAHAQACREQSVIMISTSWCSACRKARNFFMEHDIDFEEIDAERSSNADVRALYRRVGVPIIIVGSVPVRGFNEPVLRELLCLDD